MVMGGVKQGGRELKLRREFPFLLLLDPSLSGYRECYLVYSYLTGGVQGITL